VKNRANASIGRRDFFRVLAVGAAAAATASVCDSARAGDFPDKRKARYRANSANVQAFYRVNRYPAK
jgi:TAT (twin-arginine translocation) pathway signal sequence